MTEGGGLARALADELVEAFGRLARGDFSVRLPRNYRRDTEDALAFFVNLIAEQLERLMAERDRAGRDLEAGIIHLNEQFLALAAGDFATRARRSGRGDPLDVLAYVFNNVVVEVGALFGDNERQRQVLEAILESMIDGVLLLDAQGRIRRSNAAMARLLGYEPAQLVDRPVAEILAAREQALASRLGELVANGPFRDRDTAFRAASGETVSMALNGSPHRDATGALVGVVLVARDDRELKQVQGQLQMTDRLATMGTVAAGVAHEINNPLAFVIANLDFVREELASLRSGDPLSPERVEDIERALKASRGGADRVRRIVGDLRTFSRSQVEKAAPLDVNALLDSSLNLIGNELRHHAQVSKEYGVVPRVEGNEGRLVQVFLNLLQNAAQAIPVGNAGVNRIRVVSGTDDAGGAFVEIHDTGCGIGHEHLPRIFDPFFTTKPVGVGTGLGLSICHRIVGGMGGRFEVVSQPGVGSTFRVVLPASPGDAAAAPLSERSPGRGAAAPRRRMLVVDDEPEVGQAIVRVLGRTHQVDVATRASEALSLLQSRAYDLVLCDLLMPEMTGMELYDRLAASQPDVARRVVFMTAGAFGPSAREFLDRVPNQRLEKPFDSRALRALIDDAAHGAR